MIKEELGKKIVINEAIRLHQGTYRITSNAKNRIYILQNKLNELYQVNNFETVFKGKLLSEKRRLDEKYQ